MIFVSSYPVTVMLLLNTFHKCNKSLLVPDVINVYWSTAFILSIDYSFQFPERKMNLHIRSDGNGKIKELHTVMLPTACIFPYLYPIHRMKLNLKSAYNLLKLSIRNYRKDK
jgi:hypothetical protein